MLDAYARRLTLVVEHSTQIEHSRLMAGFDQQLEDSRVHWMVNAGVSDLDVIRFRGLGNNTPGGNDEFFAVNRRQWTLEPAIGLRVRTKNDLSFGPVFKFSEMDANIHTQALAQVRVLQRANDGRRQCLLAIPQRRWLEAIHLENGLVIGPSSPRGGKHNLFPLVLHDGVTQDLFGQARD